MATAVVGAVFQLFLLSTADAGQAKLTLVSTQDHGRRLPTENILFFDPGNPTLKLQLESLSSRNSKPFPRTRLTLIDGHGDSREFTSDDDGQVTIDNISDGLYGVAAFNAHAHASTVFALRSRASAAVEAVTHDFAGQPATAVAVTARLVMATAIGGKLAALVDENLIADPDVPTAAVDANVVDGLGGLSPFGYQVQLGTGGVLRGQLITVMRPTSRYSAVKGTRITLTKNGIPIATVQANALGMFKIGGVRPGTHGVIVTGRHGYAAFAFEAVDTVSVVEDRDLPYQFVSARTSSEGTILPIALVPPTMIPAVLKSTKEHFSQITGGMRTPVPEWKPQAIEIADADVAITDIPMNFSGGSIADSQSCNPLRSAAAATGGVGSGGSGGSVSGGSTAGAVVGIAAAIAIPLAVSNRSSPGIPISNSGD
jgi:hypothetical protein